MSSEAVAAGAYLITANSNENGKRKKTRWWIRDLFDKRIGNCRGFSEKRISNDSSLFKNSTHIGRQDFDFLVKKVTPWVEKANTNYRNAIPVQVRVLRILRYLAGDVIHRYVSLQNCSVLTFCEM
ncbi:hypothetical protein JTB14_015682 [Gonioctena quinquepunctata]|nr:hypothetical protein JTB14_015682 [Gonioctena quinquepunctata]